MNKYELIADNIAKTCLLILKQLRKLKRANKLTSRRQNYIIKKFSIKNGLKPSYIKKILNRPKIKIQCSKTKM